MVSGPKTCPVMSVPIRSQSGSTFVFRIQLCKSGANGEIRIQERRRETEGPGRGVEGRSHQGSAHAAARVRDPWYQPRPAGREFLTQLYASDVGSPPCPTNCARDETDGGRLAAADAPMTRPALPRSSFSSMKIERKATCAKRCWRRCVS